MIAEYANQRSIGEELKDRNLSISESWLATAVSRYARGAARGMKREIEFSARLTFDLDQSNVIGPTLAYAG